MEENYIRRKINISILLLYCFLFSIHNGNSFPVEKHTLIFPIPQEISVKEDHFKLDEETLIIIPEKVSDSDLSIARFLVEELSDKYGLALQIERVSNISSDRKFILMGSIDNFLVKEYCKKHNLDVTAESPGSEGYVLKVSKQNIVIAGSDCRGAFYGLQSLRQLIRKDSETLIQCVDVRDWPNMPFRGIKLYIPGQGNILFFKRFLRDFMALYKFNKVIIEVNAVMRFDRHPELNAGWKEFSQDLDYSRRNSSLGVGNYHQNSTHHDAGDGGILEKQEVKDLVQYSNQCYIEVIPEITSLTHSYYLLTRHRELADVQNAEWPSTYCPSNPKTYELLFDVFDEYIEVMNPKMISIGHDEWWGSPIDYCPLCEGKDYYALFAEDVNKIYDYLTKKDIKVSMWGDHLLESVRGKGHVNRTSLTGYKYQTPGGLPLSMVKEEIPKDILILNWFFEDIEKDIELEQLGFKQVYGNFEPGISNWDKRKELSGLLGGAPSSWAATTEFNFGKDCIVPFIACANLLWSKHQLKPEEFFETAESLMPQVRMNLDGVDLPSEGSDPVIPLKIDSYFNTSSGDNLLNVDLSTIKSGRVGTGHKIFDLTTQSSESDKCALTVITEGKNTIPPESGVKAIKINEDVSSLIFLHACAKSSKNIKAYRKIYNFDDSSDLLGWYEVVYEDGFIETIPIRYGYNILEWNVQKLDNFQEENKEEWWLSNYRHCYGADAVDCSTLIQENPITFFAFEWKNKRFGKKVKEINLKGSSGFINSLDSPQVIEENAIMLVALSVVKKREVPNIKPLK